MAVSRLALQIRSISPAAPASAVVSGRQSTATALPSLFPHPPKTRSYASASKPWVVRSSVPSDARDRATPPTTPDTMAPFVAPTSSGWSPSRGDSVFEVISNGRFARVSVLTRPRYTSNNVTIASAVL